MEAMDDWDEEHVLWWLRDEVKLPQYAKVFAERGVRPRSPPASPPFGLVSGNWHKTIIMAMATPRAAEGIALRAGSKQRSLQIFGVHSLSHCL